MSRSEYDASRYLSAPRGLSTTKWRAPIRLYNALPAYWVVLFSTVVLALSVAL